MARSDFRFRFPLRVRYAECDMQGIVFNSRYLEYLDVGVTEYWRAVGATAENWGAEDWRNFDFHVARNLIDYRKPLLLDETFDICLRADRIGTTSMSLTWEIHGHAEGDDQDDLRVEGAQVCVHVATARGAPAPVPAQVIEMFSAYEGRELQRKAAA
ncbi:acyl-CoA thioesterase [Pacificimonas sp. ICDLI1SI03]